MHRKLALALLLFPIAAFAQNGTVNGFCTLGATQAALSSLTSTNFQQGIAPSCTVTVYLTGTSTPATLYANASNTPLSNPFTASASGQFTFFASVSNGYDVVLSGGVAPNNFPSPVVYTNVAFGGGGGNFVSLNTLTLQTMLGPLDTPTLNGDVYVQSGETITHAIGRLAGEGHVIVPCGTYSENIVITASDFRITGQEPGCVILQPLVTSSPLISINATGTGTTGINYTEFSDLSLICPPTTSCGDAIQITGDNIIGQPNDWILFTRIVEAGTTANNTAGTYGFLNGLDITGRSIWTLTEDSSFNSNRNNGININEGSNQAYNVNIFNLVRAAGNFKYGLYAASSNTVNPIESLTFQNGNIEYNGQNTSLANCAGVYINGSTQAIFQGNTFEGDCVGNTSDSKFSEARVTGTYNQMVSFKDNTFNQAASSPQWAIYNDTNQTQGSYDGNHYTFPGHTEYIAVGPSTLSSITDGTNYNEGIPSVSADVNGLSHFRSMSPFATDYTLMPAIGGTTLTLNGLQNFATLTCSGAETINNISPGILGQWLVIKSSCGSPITFNYQHGGAGQIIGGDTVASSATLLNGGTVLAFYDGSNWDFYGNNLYAAALTGTANTFVFPQTMNQGILVPNNVAAVSMANNTGTQCPMFQSDSGNNYAIGDFSNCMTGGTFILWGPGGTNQFDLSAAGPNVVSPYPFRMNNTTIFPNGMAGFLGTSSFYALLASGPGTPGQCWLVGSDGGATSGACPGAGSGGVTQVVAGTNITLSPSGGTGVVTINATGGGGSIKCNVTITPSGLTPSPIPAGKCAPDRASSPATITSCTGFTTAAAVTFTAQSSYVNTTGWSPVLSPIIPVVYVDPTTNNQIDYYLCNPSTTAAVSPATFGARLVITP